MELVIIGDPYALPRARVNKKKFYDPSSDKKKNFGWKVKSLLPRKNNYPLEDCINLELEFFIEMPKSWSKRKKEEFFAKPHIKKLDLDNLIKFVCDSLNGILWKDDCQIFSIDAIKCWSDNPRTIIRIND